ncbi:MAG: triose-phosphate isomerase [Candidatus Bathyarchaeota archaeon]|nr:MAG: triose-phosphate isomerase [Candidatus Bathyarchaeota archaeon]
MKKLWLPLILVNFKTYLEGTGRKARGLAEIAQKVSDEVGVCIGLAPQYTDIAQIARIVSLPIFSQHIDHYVPGSFTGHILPEAIKETKAVGTLINHSERRLCISEIDATIRRVKDLGLISVVCTNNANVSASTAALNPDFIAIEPPELIGTGIPVSKAKPQIVTTTIKQVKKINPAITILCGAGISNGADVSAALKLGTNGVLVASGIVKAKRPYKTLMEFAQATTK